MTGYLTTPWSDFAVAIVGGAAALNGLPFVAERLNLAGHVGRSRG
jgi:hypothetical protein